MSALEPAYLDVLDARGTATASVRVQFNPATMRLQMSNSNDGGSSRGRQTQQYNGSASTTLTLDLEFDTSDEGSTSSPVDVRTRTAGVRQFVLPGGKGSKQAPPRVTFRWGTFSLTGVMDSLTEELGYFASSGAPLRAKLSVSIKEQDPRFNALERGAGANPGTAAPAAGEPSAAAPRAAADSALPALAGETPADFLARNGLAPEAWRALGGALDALADGIELEAGVDIEFDSSLSVGLGLGASAGFSAGLDAGPEVTLGLAGGSAPTPAGVALSAAGGLTAATETAKATEASAAAAASRAGFGLSSADGPPATAGGASSTSRAPLVSTPDRTGPAARSPLPAPAPPRADPRSTTYGRGVPLRDRVGVPGTEAAAYVVLGSERNDRTPPTARAPWERLPHPGTPRGGGGCGCGCGGAG